MMPVKELGVAVIGDEDLVAGMRLAGVSRCVVVSGGGGVRDIVRKALAGYINEAVGIVIVQEDFLVHIDDIVRRLKDEKKAFPLVVEVPSKRGAKDEEVIGRYKAFVRRFIGFDIQL